jgi:ATP-dependent Lhr-like helicase
LLQRIGRANHWLNEPSRAILVPGTRFEVLECRAQQATEAGAQDATLSRVPEPLTSSHSTSSVACEAAFDPDALFEEVRSAVPYARLTRQQFDRTIDFVSTGGYALRSYERFAKLEPDGNGQLRVANARIAQQYRLNVGTILDAPHLKVRLVAARGGRGSARQGGRVLGEVEEYFAEQLTPGTTFVFAGQVLRFEGLRDTEVFVSHTEAEDPIIPSYDGGKFPLSTHHATRVRAMLAKPETWPELPQPAANWLMLQSKRSVMPGPDEVVVETFPRNCRHFLVAYPFEGRLAHQALGMLLTRRLDRAGAKPSGFVANDYALATWGYGDVSGLIADGRLSLAGLFDEDMLGDDLDAWLAESSLMKRTFRIAAVIAGLIERRHPGAKSNRGARSRCRQTSSMMCCDGMIPATFCSKPPGQTRQRGFSTSSGSALFLLASRTESGINLYPGCRRCRSRFCSKSVYGQDRDAILREVADVLIREAAGEI